MRLTWTLEEIDFDQFNQQLAVNAVGPVRVTKALLPNLRDGKLKTIVNVTSNLGSIGDNADGGLLWLPREQSGAQYVYEVTGGRSGTRRLHLHRPASWVGADGHGRIQCAGRGCRTRSPAFGASSILCRTPTTARSGHSKANRCPGECARCLPFRTVGYAALEVAAARRAQTCPSRSATTSPSASRFPALFGQRHAGDERHALRHRGHQDAGLAEIDRLLDA